MTNERNDYETISAEVYKTERMIWKIQSRYNPEKDIRPDNPLVNWAEFDLAEAVNELGKAIIILKDKVADLETKINERN